MVESAQSVDSIQIAKLHQAVLETGFLSRLGTGFLNVLYKYLIKREIVLVYREGGAVRGFVSCTLNSKRVMRRFIVRPDAILSLLLALLKKPSLMRASFETMMIPLKHKTSGGPANTQVLPEAELLSITVEPGFQKGGAGTALLAGLEKTLRERGVGCYRVVAGATLTGANNFYRKNGFQLAGEVNIHGKDISNIYCKSLI